MSPPEVGRGSESHRAPAPQTPALTKDQHKHRSAGIRHRAAAAAHLAPLQCGCRDPLFCRHHSDDHDLEPLTDNDFEAWGAAAVHLWAHGLRAKFPADVQRRHDEYLRRWWADRR